MKIAIHCAELDEKNIDGTRTYIAEHLKRLHAFDESVRYDLYHKRTFNPLFAVPKVDVYNDHILAQFPLWTQTLFARALFKDTPDVLWMPLHNMPRLRPHGMKTVVTIHDLGWKYFPETFTASVRNKLEAHTVYALRHADHIIAVSHSTKNDVMKFYPTVTPEKITVVHLGIDTQNIPLKSSRTQKITQKKFRITKDYLICVGGIQPRKNLACAIKAFESLRKGGKDLQLVIVGGDAWMAAATHARARQSVYANDIIFTGSVTHQEKYHLLSDAKVFLFPSLYEGFGIGTLEAFAAGVPAVVAHNSSLSEIAGDAALYFDAQSAPKLAECVQTVLNDEQLASTLAEKGRERLQKFTWDTAVKQTYDILTK